MSRHRARDTGGVAYSQPPFVPLSLTIYNPTHESEGHLRLREGTPYPLVHGLENAGFILGCWVEVKEQPRRRRYYRLTEKGIREPARREQEWRVFADAMKLALGAHHA